MILVVLVLVVMIIWLHHHPIRPVVLVVPASCTQLTKNCLSCDSFVGAPLVEVIKALALKSQPRDKRLDHWGAVKSPGRKMITSDFTQKNGNFITGFL